MGNWNLIFFVIFRSFTQTWLLFLDVRVSASHFLLNTRVTATTFNFRHAMTHYSCQRNFHLVWLKGNKKNCMTNVSLINVLAKKTSRYFSSTSTVQRGSKKLMKYNKQMQNKANLHCNHSPKLCYLKLQRCILANFARLFTLWSRRNFTNTHAANF